MHLTADYPCSLREALRHMVIQSAQVNLHPISCDFALSPSFYLFLLSPQTRFYLISPFPSAICLGPCRYISSQYFLQQLVNTLSVRHGVLMQSLCHLNESREMWMASKRWCLSGEGGERRKTKTSSWWKSDGEVTLIPEWILNQKFWQGDEGK